MANRRSTTLRVLLAAVIACVLAAIPARAKAEATSGPTAAGTPWCAKDFEALPGDVCYIDGRTKAPRRTLVIWLHGIIGKNTNWSHNHEKMLQRVAKDTGIEVLFPRAPAGDAAYAWPGTAEAQDKTEAGLIEQWMTAKTALEKRENKSFDEVFIFGFSSGAYFTSSLAMRGRVDVDGYAVFAGGQPMPAPAAPVTHFAPVFVGICASDPTGTANHGRAFAGALASAGIPRMAMELQVGHDLSGAHFVNALSFLRAKMKGHTAPA